MPITIRGSGNQIFEVPVAMFSTSAPAALRLMLDIQERDAIVAGFYGSLPAGQEAIAL